MDALPDAINRLTTQDGARATRQHQCHRGRVKLQLTGKDGPQGATTLPGLASGALYEALQIAVWELAYTQARITGSGFPGQCAPPNG